MDPHDHTNSSNLQLCSTGKTKILLLGETISETMEFTKTVNKLLNVAFRGFSNTKPFPSHEGLSKSGRKFKFLLGDFSSLQSEQVTLSFCDVDCTILALVVNDATFLSRMNVIVKESFPLNLFSRIIFLFNPPSSNEAKLKLNEIPESKNYFKN